MECSMFKLKELPIPFWDIKRKLQKKKNTGQVLSSRLKKKNRIKEFIVSKLIMKYGFFYGCRFPDLNDLWAFSASRWALNNGTWDLVITTGGPYSVHRVGYHLKKKNCTANWCVDWRDLWTDNHIFRGIHGLRWYEKQLEKKFHTYADLITTVSDPLADILRTKTDTRVEVVYNGVDPDDYNNISKEKYFPDDGVFRISYTGTIYKGKRDPSPLFKALSEMKKIGNLKKGDLKVYFAGSNADVGFIADKYSVQEFYEYLGFLKREDALRLQRDSDALLFLEYDNKKVGGILTGKLFEYLYIGKRILGVGVTEDSGTGKLINEKAESFSVGTDIDHLKSVLEEWLLKLSIDKKINNKSEWNVYLRSVQSQKLLNLIG